MVAILFPLTSLMSVLLGSRLVHASIGNLSNTVADSIDAVDPLSIKKSTGVSKIIPVV